MILIVIKVIEGVAYYQTVYYQAQRCIFCDRSSVSNHMKIVQFIKWCFFITYVSFVLIHDCCPEI